MLVQKSGYGGADIYLDHDENDDTTVRYLRKKSAARLQRRYLDDIYSLMDGVRLGWGKAVLPRHLVAQEPELEVINPDRTLEIPVVLHHYEQPFYSRLHQGVLDALVRNCPRFLL